MKLSTFLSLNQQDWLKGLVMAVLGAVYAIIEPLLSSGTLTFNWKYIGTTALSTSVLYLVKNLFTPIPKMVEVDPVKTIVVDVNTKDVIVLNPNK